MQKLFTKILVPVAFDRNTRWYVNKAVQLANKFGCDVFLLHAQIPTVSLLHLHNIFFTGSLTGYSQEELSKKMSMLEQEHRPELKEGLVMTSAVSVGYWQSALKDAIVSERIDLILIPRSHRRLKSVVLRHINVNMLSQQTNCPIMTITRSFNVNQLENVVVPIHNLLPVKKLLVAHYLSLETGCNIYLMGSSNGGITKTEGSYLMKAYQLLYDFGKPVVHCALREEIGTAEGILAYARDIRANLIVVNPGQESRLHGWWNRLRGKHLCRESDIPVMTVAV
ncbi:MAG: hypothetical protein ABL876_03700 [Chitinophagaceae bacterium]